MLQAVRQSQAECKRLTSNSHTLVGGGLPRWTDVKLQDVRVESARGLVRARVSLLYAETRTKTLRTRQAVWWLTPQADGRPARMLRAAVLDTEAVGVGASISGDARPLTPAEIAAAPTPKPDLGCGSTTRSFSGEIVSKQTGGRPLRELGWLRLKRIEEAPGPDGGRCLRFRTAAPWQPAAVLYITGSWGSRSRENFIADISTTVTGAIRFTPDPGAAKFTIGGSRGQLAVLLPRVAWHHVLTLSISTVSDQGEEPLIPEPLAGGERLQQLRLPTRHSDARQTPRAYHRA